MDQLPVIAINGYDSESTDLGYHGSGIGTQKNARSLSAGQTSAATKAPALFHKVKNQKSILALVVSDSKIYAGTQGGEILVSRVYDISGRSC